MGLKKRKKVKWECRNEQLSRIGKKLLNIKTKPKVKILLLCPSTGKKSYTKKQAQRKAKATVRNPTPLRYYRCLMCPNWHLTKSKKERKVKKQVWIYKK